MCDTLTLPESCKVAIEEFIQKNGLKDVALRISPGSEKGDNYVGEMHKIEITSKHNKSVLFNLIAKTTSDKAISETLKVENLYNREADLYNIILPTFKSFQDEHKIPIEERFDFVKCYIANTNVILMEDMSAKGYQIYNRYNSFDSDHLELNGTPVDMKFVDWQVARSSSPITDLSHMVYCSTDAPMRAKYNTRLFNMYYEVIRKQLTYFGCDVEECFPRAVFENHLKEFLPYGLLMGTIVIPIVLSNKGTELQAIDLCEADDNRSNAMSVREPSVRLQYTPLRKITAMRERLWCKFYESSLTTTGESSSVEVNLSTRYAQRE
ncbi:uncharacterized protein LOC143914727 [Arctopsyche grandis]|uniref:uncharacterized protein LOC143914727 n=1 Tax=Arctopsyche grandis TaxID=121162 RepID=UPI00406D6EE7